MFPWVLPEGTKKIPMDLSIRSKHDSKCDHSPQSNIKSMPLKLQPKHGLWQTLSDASLTNKFKFQRDWSYWNTVYLSNIHIKVGDVHTQQIDVRLATRSSRKLNVRSHGCFLFTYKVISTKASSLPCKPCRQHDPKTMHKWRTAMDERFCTM